MGTSVRMKTLQRELRADRSIVVVEDAEGFWIAERSRLDHCGERALVRDTLVRGLHLEFARRSKYPLLRGFQRLARGAPWIMTSFIALATASAVLQGETTLVDGGTFLAGDIHALRGGRRCGEGSSPLRL